MQEQPYDLGSARLALEEMRLAMEKKWQAADSLSTNGFQLLGAAGVVLVLAISIPGAPAQAWPAIIYWVLMAAAVAGYLYMLAIVLNAIQPSAYTTSIKPDWEVIQKSLLLNDELSAIVKLISGYTDWVPANEAINRIRAKQINKGIKLLFLIVLLLLAARVVGIVGG